MSGCGPGLPCYERCWAREWHHRFRGGDFSVNLHPEKLDEPLRLRKPSTIGVSLLGDLFHDDVPMRFIVEVMDRMIDSRHTFILLTKRPARMREWANLHATAGGMIGRPLPGVWLGVSVEDQATADERIPILLDTPAAHRWLSLEPQVGPVDLPLGKYLGCLHGGACEVDGPDNDGSACDGCDEAYPGGLDWVVQGCESGPSRRPFDLRWARSVRNACKRTNVPYYLKQMPDPIPGSRHDGVCGAGLGSKVIAHPFLDGRQHLALPWVTP